MAPFHVEVLFFSVVAPTEDRLAGVQFCFVPFRGILQWAALVSKAPKGLLVLRAYPRFCTGRSISLTLEGRQLSPRDAIHTSLQLRDNLLRYLCTVKIPRPLNRVTGQAGPLIRNIARGDVFGKQARLVFAEFLPFILVFPGLHTCVGLTSIRCLTFLLFVWWYIALCRDR